MILAAIAASLHRAIDKHREAVDFLLTAKRFFSKMLRDGRLLSPDRIGRNGARTSEL